MWMARDEVPVVPGLAVGPPGGVRPARRGAVMTARRPHNGSRASEMTMADDSQALAETARLEREYWRAVTRLLRDYRESRGSGTVRRGPGSGDGPDEDEGPDEGVSCHSAVQAARAAARFRAEATAARDRALRARADAESAAGRVDVARTALQRARPWQLRARIRQRGEAAREGERLAAARREAERHFASYELSLRKARTAELTAVALRRSDRAHRAAAAAVGRAMGWRPGNAPPVRLTIYAADQDGIEVRERKSRSLRDDGKN